MPGFIWGASSSPNCKSDFISYAFSKIAGETKRSLAAQIGVGLRYRMASSIVLGLDALAAYTGGFETGDTRVGNLGVTDINRYKIDDVWRMNIAASVRFEF